MAVLLAIGLAGALAPNVARPPIVERGERCPGIDVATRVGRYLDDEAPPDLDVETDLAREDDVWSLRVRIDGAERVFRAPQCATVIDAAAFVIAVTADPAVADRPPPGAEPEPPTIPEPQPEPETTTGVDPQPPPPPETDGEAAVRPTDGPDPPPPPPAPPERRLWLYAAADVGVDFGALPTAGLFVRPAVGVAGEHFVAAATGSFRTRSRVVAPGLPQGVDEAGGDIGGWSAGVRGCWLPSLRARRLLIPLCGGVEGGQVLGRGFGFPGAQDTTLPWLAITASPGIGFAPIPTLSLVLRGEVGVAPLRGTLSIEGLGDVHAVRAVVGRVIGGLEVRFGRS